MDGSGTKETNRAAAALGEIGVMLRRRREEIGQDLAAIAAITHIRQHYLKAIEDGRRKDLPGTAYMIGYIRSYANYLGFDGNRLITDYHDELAGNRHWEEKRAEAAEPPGARHAQTRMSPGVVLATLVVLGAAGYVAWGYATAPRGDAAEMAAAETPGSEPAEPIAPDSAPEPVAAPATPSPTGANASAPADAVPTDTTPTGGAPTEAASTETAPATDTTPTTDTGPATGAASGMAEALPETAGGAERSDEQIPPEADIAVPDEETLAELPPPGAAASEPAGGKIVVRARLESWIQITNAEREVIFSRVLRAGETYTVPDEEGLLFTTGNAGGVEITVDGTKLRSLGTVGLVKRDIPLDPQKLKDGTAFDTSRATTASD